MRFQHIAVVLKTAVPMPFLAVTAYQLTPLNDYNVIVSRLPVAFTDSWRMHLYFLAFVVNELWRHGKRISAATVLLSAQNPDDPIRDIHNLLCGTLYVTRIASCAAYRPAFRLRISRPTLGIKTRVWRIVHALISAWRRQFIVYHLCQSIESDDRYVAWTNGITGS